MENRNQLRDVSIMDVLQDIEKTEKTGQKFLFLKKDLCFFRKTLCFFCRT